MWSEEKIRAVLNKKEQVLKDTKAKYETNRDWLFAGEIMKVEDVVASTARELADQRAMVEKLEIQVEVLKYILDS